MARAHNTGLLVDVGASIPAQPGDFEPGLYVWVEGGRHHYVSGKHAELLIEAMQKAIRQLRAHQRKRSGVRRVKAEYVANVRGPKPHALLKTMRPDEVAECIDGVTEDLYRKLWACMSKIKPNKTEDNPSGLNYPGEVNSDMVVAKFWKDFDNDDKATLNRLAEAHDNEFRD